MQYQTEQEKFDADPARAKRRETHHHIHVSELVSLSSSHSLPQEKLKRPPKG